jgi:rod shape-determining protein MreC
MLERRRTATLLVVLCLGHVLLISSQVPSRSGSSALHGAAFGAVSQLQRIVSGFSDGIGGVWSHYFGLRNASRENDALRQRVLDLEGQLAAERARASRIDALEEALALQKTVVAPTLAARVIAGNPVPRVMTVNLDRGTADGVTANMAVINGSGVVGRVISGPGRSACTVQLLIDRAASAGATLEASGTTALASGGFADGNLRLSLLSSAATVAVGERVLTSGQDGIYPSGFVIGRVAQINGAGKNREVVVEPGVNFSRLNVVLIVLARPAAAPDAKPGKPPSGPARQ